MVDFLSLRWTSLGTFSYEVSKKPDFYSLKLNGTAKRIFRVDWKNNIFSDHADLVGYLHGTVNIWGSEATIIHQKMYLGSNIVIIPPDINKIEYFYLHHYKAYGGKFTLQYYEITDDIVIDFTLEQFNNLVIELGLINNSLELINNNLVNLPSATVLQLGNVIANQLEIQLEQQQQNLLTEFTTLLSSAL